MKTALIVGSGGGFGSQLRAALETKNYTVYGISGSAKETSNTLAINWQTCGIADFEKFLRQLPNLKVVIFNQNSVALKESFLTLGSDTLDVWRQSQAWTQSHYVNCVLPMHMLHTLASSKSVTNSTIISWVLSGVIKDTYPTAPIDYVGQKFQNYTSLRALALKNVQTFIGICPGQLTTNNAAQKASKVINILTEQVGQSDSGHFFELDD
jgi:NAD(P)-dependent dehydrogenase (short-subunit alcohol dehydrogenase family)